LYKIATATYNGTEVVQNK